MQGSSTTETLKNLENVLGLQSKRVCKQTKRL